MRCCRSRWCCEALRWRPRRYSSLRSYCSRARWCPSRCSRSHRSLPHRVAGPTPRSSAKPGEPSTTGNASRQADPWQPPCSGLAAAARRPQRPEPGSSDGRSGAAPCCIRRHRSSFSDSVCTHGTHEPGFPKPKSALLSNLRRFFAPATFSEPRKPPVGAAPCTTQSWPFRRMWRAHRSQWWNGFQRSNDRTA